MDERLRFVARLLEGEKMAPLCREFDVSRKTGYRLFERYKDCGLEGLSDRSRRPYGTVRYFVREAGFRHQMTNLSPKMTANWVLASIHSRGGRFHSSAA
jgi:hypothetical protein